jgi:hypothetical protein
MPTTTIPSDPAPLPLLLTPRAAAVTLAVSLRTLWGMTTPRGPIPVVKIGRSVRYAVRDLEAFVDRATEGGRS